MCCSAARSQRVIVEVCMKWTNQRKAFGKPLNSQAVIRAKLAEMIARVETCQAWLENITHQMCHMVRISLAAVKRKTAYLLLSKSYKDQAQKLAGPIGLLKMYITRSAQDTAREAVQIFGGRGVTRTGMGRFIEHVINISYAASYS